MTPEMKTVAILLALLLALNLLAPFVVALHLMRCLDAQRRESRAMLCALAQALGVQLVPAGAIASSPPPPPASPLPRWSPPPAVKMPTLVRAELGAGIVWSTRNESLPPGHPHCPACRAPDPFHEPGCCGGAS